MFKKSSDMENVFLHEFFSFSSSSIDTFILEYFGFGFGFGYEFIFGFAFNSVGYFF